MGMSDAALPKRGNNYVLIGLPGCGKSTLGRRAAEKLGLKFYDTDELVIKALGTPITFGRLLRGYSDKETQALMKLSKKAKRSVIASGGSVLSFDHNISILKRLGYILFIDRDSELLLASGKSRYSVTINNREPVSLNSLNIKSHMDLQYADIADITVENHGDEDDGLANLISAIKSLERDARS
jgi:shikimate kinase